MEPVPGRRHRQRLAAVRGRVTLGYGDRAGRARAVHRHPGPPGHRASWAPTPAASPRCCAGWPGCCGRRRGRCCWTGRRSPRCRPRQVARTLGLLPQNPVTPEGVSVVDLVGRGRTPTRARLRRWSHADDEARGARHSSSPTPSTSPSAWSTSSPAASGSACGSRWPSRRRPTCCCSTSRRRTSTSPTRSRSSTCSPTSTRPRGTTIVMVLHDLNLAARYADHLVAMREGRIVAAGAPGRGDHRGLRARGLRHGLPGRRRPGHRNAHGDPAGSPLPTPPRPEDRMTSQDATQQSPPRPACCSPRPTVHAVTRLSPAFVRVELASPGVRRPRRGRVRHPLQGRPPRARPARCRHPAGAGGLLRRAGWRTPDDVRSPMRTYTIRDVVRDGDDVRLVVDFVVHEDAPGHGLGPGLPLGARRAARRRDPGDRAAPAHRVRRHRVRPGRPRAPAPVRRRDRGARPGADPRRPGRRLHRRGVRGGADQSADILDLPTPAGVRGDLVRPRRRRRAAAASSQEVRRHLGLPPSTEFEAAARAAERPRHRRLGDPALLLRRRGPRGAAAGAVVGHDLDDTYAWIAGESWLVKALRRSLVTELGLDRAPGRLHGLLA